jgi:hypothetical protein
MVYCLLLRLCCSTILLCTFSAPPAVESRSVARGISRQRCTVDGDDDAGGVCSRREGQQEQRRKKRNGRMGKRRRRRRRQWGGKDDAHCPARDVRYRTVPPISSSSPPRLAGIDMLDGSKLPSKVTLLSSSASSPVISLGNTPGAMVLKRTPVLRANSVENMRVRWIVPAFAALSARKRRRSAQ